MMYDAPSITDLGTIRDLTLTGNGKGGGSQDGMNPNNNNGKNNITGSVTRL